LNELVKNKKSLNDLINKYKLSQKIINSNYSESLSLTFEEVLDAIYCNNKTKNDIKSLFNYYQNFINMKYQENKSKELNDNKDIENDEFFKEENIVSFLKDYKNFEASTYNNRLGIFRRIIRIMTGNPLWNYINYSVQEKKTKTEKLLTPTQKTHLLNLIETTKSNDLLILFELVFDLGFSIYQVSRIRVKDIFFNQEIIELNYKGKKKVRQINYEMSKILMEHINNKKLNSFNFLVYNNFIETKKINRYKYLNSIISDLILRCQKIEDATKDNLISKMNYERKSSGLNLTGISIINEFENCQKGKMNEKNDDKNVNLKIFKNDSGLYSNNSNISKNDFNFNNNELNSFYSLFENSLDFTIPKINDYSELFFSNSLERNYEDINFKIILKEINHDSTYYKDILLETLKKMNIRFVDHPIKQLSFLGLNQYTNKIYSPPELSENNMEKYKKLKLYSKEGYYNGLKLCKLNENDFAIQALQDIQKYTLLFEIAGEIVTKDYLQKYQNELKKKSFYFFDFCDEKALESNIIILLRDYGNLAFFLRNITGKNEENVKLYNFINKENNSIIALCLSIKKIKKNEILFIKNKYSNLDL